MRINMAITIHELTNIEIFLISYINIPYKNFKKIFFL